MKGAVTAGERNLEKTFKDWLKVCHETLDKRIRFRDIAGADKQVGRPGPGLGCVQHRTAAAPKASFVCTLDRELHGGAAPSD